MPRARIGTPSEALARGPILPKVWQYGPLAYNSHVITYTYYIILYYIILYYIILHYIILYYIIL